MFQKQNRSFIIFKNILQKKHLNIFLVSRIKKNDNRKHLYNNFINLLKNFSWNFLLNIDTISNTYLTKLNLIIFSLLIFF